MRYATRLDLIDAVTGLAARSAAVEVALRHALSWRRSVAYALWALASRIYRVLGVERDRSLAELLAERAGGANDLLLLTESPLRIPELVGIAGTLAGHQELQGAVTVIVQDRKAEAELRPLARQAAIITVQRFWLDHGQDVANHDAAHEVLSLFRGELPLHAERDLATAMFDGVSMHLHSSLISGLRIAAAVRAAREEGARIVVAALDGDLRVHELCCEAMARAGERPMVALALRGIRDGFRFDRVARGFGLNDRLAQARAHLASYEDDAAPGEAAERPPRSCAPAGATRDGAATREIALVTDALPGSIYWQAVFNLAEAARLEGRPVRALASRASIARRLRPVCTSVEIAGVMPGATSGARFAAHYSALLSVAAAVADKTTSAASPLVALAADYAVARLATPASIDNIGYRSFRMSDTLDRWLCKRLPAAVVVLPHWSVLAWAALGRAHALDLPTASMPVVTVSGNSASIVEWDGVDMIGCYGTQCRRAFMDLGYSTRKLSLVGNLSLDHAMFLPRESARSRHRVYRDIGTRGRRLILFATSGVNRNEHDILRAIAALCRDPSANASLVIRPHPSIGRSFYAECCAEFGSEDCAIVAGGPVHDAIAAADVVITDFSTVGADAVHLKRPLLVVNTTGAPFPANNYAHFGVAVEANAVAEIAPLLRRLLDEGFWWPAAAESLDKFTQAYNWRGDGASCHRFLAELDARCAVREGARVIAS